MEQEYHHKPHDELGGQSPLERYLGAPNVGRPLPVEGGQELGEKFRLRVQRRQRKSDGTVGIEGRRFEVPSASRHLSELTVRYARWDLSLVDLYDAQRRQSVCRIFPVDKQRNADGSRAVRARSSSSRANAAERAHGTAAHPPARGLPRPRPAPAYIPYRPPAAEPVEPSEDANQEADGDQEETTS